MLHLHERVYLEVAMDVLTISRIISKTMGGRKGGYDLDLIHAHLRPS